MAMHHEQSAHGHWVLLNQSIGGGCMHGGRVGINQGLSLHTQSSEFQADLDYSRQGSGHEKAYVSFFLISSVISIQGQYERDLEGNP